MRTDRYTISTVIVVAAMLIVLPLLAYLQYVWLGQLSEQELGRMRNNLRTAASHFSMDFNQEMTEILKSVGGPLTGSDQKIRDELTRRIQEWKKNTLHPQLVRGLEIAPLPSGRDTISIRYDEKLSLVFCKDIFAVAIQIQDRPGFFGIIQLDKSYTVQSYLPELVRAHFIVRGTNDYEIVIRRKYGRILFASDSTSAKSVDQPDIIEPFWSLPPMPLVQMPRPFPRSESAMQSLGYNEPPGHEFQRFQNNRENLPPNRRWDENQFGKGPPRWQSVYELRIKHRAGSLEAAVSETRNRNLAIGFGVLLLLGASVMFLVISSNRERYLARQQLEFVAAISHELRTPLGILKSAGENLADGLIPDTGRVKQYGSVIKHEVLRLSNMVEKALAYAGIQSGKRKYEHHLVDLSSVISESLKNAKRRSKAVEFAFDVSIPNDLPMVVGDEDALRTALENIVSNAIKYSINERWVGVRARTIVQNDQPSIEIAVQDRGIGIPSIDIRHVFKSFFRARNAIDGQIPGSGLGLAITRHIIEEHKGTISVQSSVNGGSTFTIVLPAFRENGDRA